MISQGLTILLPAICVLAFIANRKSGLLLTLLVLPFLPRALGIGLGAEGFAFTSRRLILLSLFAFSLATLLLSRHPARINSAVFYIVALPITVYISVSIISSMLVGDSFYFVLPAAEDFLILFMSIYVASTLAADESSVVRLVKFAFLYPLIANLLLLPAELYLQRPILSFIVGQDDVTIAGGQRALLDQWRSGGYRVKGFFNGPIQLGEFLTYASIAVLFLCSRRELRTSSAALLISATFFAIFSTGSRGALAVFCMCSMVFLLTRLPKARKVLFPLIFAALLGISSALALRELLSFELVSFATFETAEERSFYARLYQFNAYLGFFVERPIIGYGYQRHIGRAFGYTHFDIFWIGLLLQSGLMGMIAFALPALLVLSLAIGSATQAQWRSLEQDLGTYVSIFILAFLIFKSVFSVPDNNIYFLLLCAVYLKISGPDLFGRSSETSRRTALV